MATGWPSLFCHCSSHSLQALQPNFGAKKALCGHTNQPRTALMPQNQNFSEVKFIDNEHQRVPVSLLGLHGMSFNQFLLILVAHYCSNYCNYWHYFTIFNFFVITEFSHYSGGASRARLPPSNLLHVRFVLVSTGKTIFLNLYCPRRFYAFFPTISNLTSQSNPFLTMVKPVIHHIKQQSNGLIIHHYNKTTTAVSMVYRFFTMGCIFHWMSTK